MWTYNNIRIFVQEQSLDNSQIIARLQPIAGGTQLQIFGHESTILRLKGLIIGDTDKYSLQNTTKDGASHPLVTPAGAGGNWYTRNLRITRTPAIYQTLRTDLDCTAPVYEFEIELQRED